MKTYKCEFCNKEFTKAQGLNSHVRQKHLDVIGDTITYLACYYLKYIDALGNKCTGCDAVTESFASLSKGFGNKNQPAGRWTCRSCAQKAVWIDADERKAKLVKMNEGIITNPKGRPKGSKNKQKYPITDAVKRRISNHPGFAFLKDEVWKNQVYERRANTLRNRTDAQIQETMHKQDETFLANGHKRMKTYKGRFTPKNKTKYVGDADKIVYRSLWERNVMRWCDNNPDVVEWASEELAIPYICMTDKRKHRYFIDFVIKFSNGERLLVEVKPKSQTLPPKQSRRTKRMLQEAATFSKNQSKWRAAKQFAEDNGCKFVIWTEVELERMGIKTSVGKKKW